MSSAVTLKDITNGIHIALEEKDLVEGFHTGDSKRYEFYSIVSPDNNGAIFVETTLEDRVQKYVIEIRPVTEWKVRS